MVTGRNAGGEASRKNQGRVPEAKSYSKENAVMEQLSNNPRRRFLKSSTMLGLGAAFSQGMIGQAFANSQPIAIDKDRLGKIQSAHFR